MAAKGLMRSRNRWTTLLVAVTVCAVGCDDAGTNRSQRATSDRREAKLFAFADRELEDEDLRAALPRGFDFTHVQRYGSDRHMQRWITVGVRFEGPVEMSRVIFYVHPHRAAAASMYRSQLDMTRQEWETDRTSPDFRPGEFPRPWRVTPDAGPVWCGQRYDSQLWCHGVHGRVYLLVQSSAGHFPEHATPTRLQIRTAQRLAKAYAAFLEEDVSA